MSTEVFEANKINTEVSTSFTSANIDEYAPSCDDVRGLATICRVNSISEIPKADSIESATVLGWNCVVRKNDFAVGDLCIYFRISTIFPKGYHRIQESQQNKPIKTRRMLGVISQGLLAPLNWLAEDFNYDVSTLKEGDDVSEIFQLKKFVPQEEEEQYIKTATKSGKTAAIRQSFPSYVPKTDEPRIQNMPNLLEEIQDEQVVITRKEDGCSATYIYRDGKFLVCGRNFVMIRDIDSENKSLRHYFRIAEEFNIEEKFRELSRNIAIQGEIVGPGINANRMKLTGLDFRVFYMYDIDYERYLSFDEMTSLCQVLSLRTVPLLYRGLAREFEPLHTVHGLLEFVGGLEYAKKIPAEGCVVRVEYDNSIGRNKRSFKVISNKYLLKNEL